MPTCGEVSICQMRLWLWFKCLPREKFPFVKWGGGYDSYGRILTIVCHKKNEWDIKEMDLNETSESWIFCKGWFPLSAMSMIPSLFIKNLTSLWEKWKVKNYSDVWPKNTKYFNMFLPLLYVLPKVEMTQQASCFLKSLKPKWGVLMMNLRFFLGYNILHCVEKIWSVSWQGDLIRYLFCNLCICSHGNVAFSLHVCWIENTES